MPNRPGTHKARRPKTPVHRPVTTPETRGKGRGGRPWRTIRERILKRDGYMCQCDTCRGVRLLADEVDHILPISQGGTDSDDNLRSINKNCHKLKTSQESGGAVSMTPAWLPSPIKPLVVVVGPPAAGKTTHVQERAHKRDLVIDLDQMALAAGKPLDDMSQAERSRLIRRRNSLLASFCEGRTAHPKAWLIATSGSFKQRKYWMDKGAQVVVIHPGMDACRDRIESDSTRSEKARASRLRALEKWR